MHVQGHALQRHWIPLPLRFHDAHQQKKGLHRSVHLLQLLSAYLLMRTVRWQRKCTDPRPQRPAVNAPSSDPQLSLEDQHRWHTNVQEPAFTVHVRLGIAQRPVLE